MRTEVIDAEYPTALQHALDVLKHGGIVAFPTDTVYGLATLPTLEESIESLYIIKDRNREKAIAILMSSYSELSDVASVVSPLAMRLAETFWPGPLTLIMPRHPRLPEILANNNTIGVRVPNHPVALGLLKLSGPLAVTSANLSGQDNACTAAEVLRQIKGRFHLLLDGGETPGGIPSTVVDCTGSKPIILRDGPISESEINQVIS
jgi:L-threonylcarbamoyladenylate synthase